MALLQRPAQAAVRAPVAGELRLAQGIRVGNDESEHQVFLSKALPHLRQVTRILPLPRGTRSIARQDGQRKNPFPTIVRDFQAVISKEIKEQMLAKEGRLPDAVIACVGGGSNAIGSFYNFIEDKSVRLIGCEAAGRGIDTWETAATISTGKLGIFHGMKSYFCQDEYGQIAPVYSISAGLDYPGVGPEHAYLHDIGRAEYVAITDEEAVEAFEYLARTEGIIPAIESAHAVAYAMKLAPTMGSDKCIVVTISGRGDKDCAAIARYRGEDIHE